MRWRSPEGEVMLIGVNRVMPEFHFVRAAALPSRAT